MCLRLSEAFLCSHDMIPQGNWKGSKGHGWGHRVTKVQPSNHLEMKRNTDFYPISAWLVFFLNHILVHIFLLVPHFILILARYFTFTPFEPDFFHFSLIFENFFLYFSPHSFQPNMNFFPRMRYPSVSHTYTQKKSMQESSLKSQTVKCMQFFLEPGAYFDKCCKP